MRTACCWCWCGCQAAKFINDQTLVHSIECDLCKCTDRFWPNCTSICQKTITDQKSTYPISTLNNVLLNISPSCQVFADVSISQSLESNEWCQSTTSGREGYVIQTPPTSLDGYNVVRAQLKDRYVNITGNNFSCSKLADGEGYIAYPSLFSPSPTFCPIAAAPEGRALSTITVSSSNTLTIPIKLTVRPDSIVNASRHELNDSKYYNADSLQSITLRLLRNQTPDTDCYGDVTQINMLRRISGFFNGRNYDSFGATALEKDEVANLTRVYPVITTNDKIGRPKGSAIWDGDAAKNAPGFDLIQW